jgi:integrase
MARPKATSIKPIKRYRADGSVLKTDYYHRATNKHLGADFEVAQILSAEIDGEQKPEPPPTTVFDGLAAAYLTSDSYRRLAPKSQKLNALYVGKLVKRFGGLEVQGITRPVVIAFREKLSKEIAAAPKRKPGEKKPNRKKGEEGPMTPDIAKHIVNKLRLLLQYAVDTGVVPANAAASAKAQFGVRARKRVWEPDELKAFMTKVPDKLKVAAALLFYTAQRPQDVMVMEWWQVTERGSRLWVKLSQQKTGELVDVPAHRDLEAILRAVKDKGGLLVPSPRDRIAWSYRNFCRAWDVAMVEAGLEDAGLQQRDLRRTAMVRMSEAGATDVQIAGVSGHTIEQTRQILKTYIPRRGEVASGAIMAWESMDDRQKAAAQAAVAAQAEQPPAG